MAWSADNWKIGRRDFEEVRRIELHEGCSQGVQEEVDLTVYPCPCCGGMAGEVIFAAANIRRGWYCVACKFLIPAIMRERKI